MDFSHEEQLRLWSRDLSLVAAILISLLSWIKGITFGWIVVRAIITFLVIYGLTLVSVVLFVKTAYSDLEEEVIGQNHNQGTLIDISLGKDVVDQIENTSEIGVGAYAGQVDPDLASGVVSHRQQADIVRRMGWK
ncbi:MAG: hypothetical protein ACYDEJ_14410 [Desulfitobacteriaceae bacterium]